jgi:hypothetical protein
VFRKHGREVPGEGQAATHWRRIAEGSSDGRISCLLVLPSFGVAEASLGVLFFAVHLLNAASHLGAAWLARRIGLVNTMVFTHLPSSLFLIDAALAPSFKLRCCCSCAAKHWSKWTFPRANPTLRQWCCRTSGRLPAV